MTNYAIFLRGVMPSGKNRVPMADLRSVLLQVGLHDVQTYIQSGNVVARSDLARDALESLVRKAIATRIGPDLAVAARTHDELADILARNPFPEQAAERTYFSLFAMRPEAAVLEQLAQSDFSPDCVRFGDEVLYTLYATRLSDSKFNNNYFERKLKVSMTTRNFNTLSRCVALSA